MRRPLGETTSAFGEYIRASKDESAVCENDFGATKNGWTSDHNPAYLASARPVVVQRLGLAPVSRSDAGFLP